MLVTLGKKLRKACPTEIQDINRRNKAARRIVGGNMSTAPLPGGKFPYGPQELTDEGRYEDAVKNMEKHLALIDVDPADIRVLNPERTYFESPLSIVNADEDTQMYKGGEPIKLEKRGDFVYTRNPDLVLAIRPADCPVAIMSAETPEGRIYMMVHFAWRGPAYGQFGDMEVALDGLGVDRATLDVYITPGGQAESYKIDNYTPDDLKEKPIPVEGNLFIGVEQDDGTEAYAFSLDTPKAVYDAFLDLGLDTYQLFLDTSDTASLKTGYSSHTRASNQKEDNVRDLVTARFHAPHHD